MKSLLSVLTVSRRAGLALLLSALALLGGCHRHSNEANQENFTQAITSYLAERGHLCTARYDWPIYVADSDLTDTRSRDALQLPVLEKLGLVKSMPMMLERTDGNGQKITAPGRSYALTAEGNKYYIHKPEVIATGGKTVTHPADFCVATLSLDKVVGWEPPRNYNGETRSSVLYTYKIDPAPFAKDPDFQRVFPMIKRVIEGQGVMQMREGVRLTKDKGWQAEEFFVR